MGSCCNALVAASLSGRNCSLASLLFVAETENAYRNLVDNKNSLVYHRRVARDLSEHCRADQRSKSLACSGYLILSLARKTSASGKQPTSVREPKIDTSLRVNSSPGRLACRPLVTSPTMTILSPAATRSIVDCITVGLPMASMTIGAPSAPVWAKTFPINFSSAFNVSAPRRCARSRPGDEGDFVLEKQAEFLFHISPPGLSFRPFFENRPQCSTRESLIQLRTKSRHRRCLLAFVDKHWRPRSTTTVRHSSRRLRILSGSCRRSRIAEITIRLPSRA